MHTPWRVERAAESLARNTVAVRGVENRLVAKSQQPFSDQLLQNRIVEALVFDPLTDARDIHLAVKGRSDHARGLCRRVLRSRRSFRRRESNCRRDEYRRSIAGTRSSHPLRLFRVARSLRSVRGGLVSSNPALGRSDERGAGSGQSSQLYEPGFECSLEGHRSPPGYTWGGPSERRRGARESFRHRCTPDFLPFMQLRSLVNRLVAMPSRRCASKRSCCLRTVSLEYVQVRKSGMNDAAVRAP